MNPDEHKSHKEASKMPTFVTTDTGEAIRAARLSAGLTQGELAKRLGVTPQTVSQYERNLIKPKYETLKKFASALNVPVLALGGSMILDYQQTFHYDASEFTNAVASALAGMAEFDSKEDEKLELLKGAFYKLNPDGQDKALERVRELTEVPRYQNPNREKEYVKVWCGPTLPNGVKQYTQIHGALSKDMKTFLKEHPHAECLLVPLKEENSVRVMLNHEYTDGEVRPAEKIQYDSLKSELYPAGDAPEDADQKKE